MTKRACICDAKREGHAAEKKTKRNKRSKEVEMVVCREREILGLVSMRDFESKGAVKEDVNRRKMMI